MKIFKRLIVAVVGLAVLAIAGVVIAVNLIDVNEYREQIETAVEEQTGRALSIDGEIKLSYYPWIGFELGELALANAPGFDGTPFLESGAAKVKVALLPLFSKKLDVKAVEFEDLALNLQRNRDGTDNWSDLQSSDGENMAETETPTDSEKSIADLLRALNINTLVIRNASLSWQDDQAGSDYSVSDLTVETSAITFDTPFHVEGSGSLLSRSSGLKADITLSTDTLIDSELQRFAANALAVTINAAGDAIPGGAHSVALNADIAANVVDETVQIDNLELKAAGMDINGRIALANYSTTSDISASLQSNEFNPATLLQALNVDLPEMADPSVMSRASFAADVSGSPESMSIGGLKVTLDDTRLEGSAAIADLSAPVPPVSFDLAVNQIDLDRYLPPTAQSSEADTATAAPLDDQTIELPVDMLRQLTASGKVGIGSLKVSNLSMRDVSLALKANQGVIRLSELSSQLYQGSLASTAKLDVTRSNPRYNATAALSNVDAEALLVDLLQDKSPVSGRTSFNAKVATGGNAVKAMRNRLNGSFDAEFADGAVNGVNLGYQVRRAKALISGQTPATEPKQVKTDFSSMNISGVIEKGVITSHDLDMRSPLMRVTGRGAVDLTKSYVDYTPTMKIAGTAQGQGGADLQDLNGLALDIPVKGYFHELSGNFVSVILAGLKDNLQNLAKARLQQEADKLKAEARARLEAEKAKVEARARAELKKKEQELAAKKAELEARAKKAQQQATQSAKDKAQDKIKSSLNKLLQ